MSDARVVLMPPIRSEFEVTTFEVDNIGEIRRELPLGERLVGIAWLRRAALLIVLIAAWEIYARSIDNPLIFPSFSRTMIALWDALVHGPLLERIWITLRVLLVGYALGLMLAAFVTGLAVSTRVGTDLLSMLTSMFNPLPAIALLPLALLWFGLGPAALVFVIIHSVLWAVALNTQTGFLSVSDTQRMAGMNYGLVGVRYVTQILIPAAFPSILAGMKIGWAFAWRTLIAAELVFGVSSSSGGLGWFIFENRNELETPYVFAGLTTVIIIGLVAEGLVFRIIEKNTVRRWGMQVN